MIKQGDIVVCIKKGSWHQDDTVKEHLLYPKYNEECIVLGVYPNHLYNGDTFISLMGFNNTCFLINNFRKVDDNFAEEVLSKVKEEIEWMEELLVESLHE